MTFDFSQPALLQADNFTPLERTPWAGSMLATTIKKSIVSSDKRIGEAWEFSTDSAFPSKLIQGEKTYDLISVMQQVEGLPFHLLVKLLNASSPLSLQVHPADDNPHLKVNECGKPESWLVLDHRPGAGIYLGFSKSFAKGELRELLRSGMFRAEYLQFVPVEVGDYFEIAPGVTHIVGPDVVVLEPQRIVPGKSGKTYRMWDWNRTYDVAGNENPQGKPRELHIDESLAIIDPLHDFGPEFANRFHRKPEQKISGLMSYPFNNLYQVHWMKSHAQEKVVLTQKQGYGCLTVLQGELEIRNEKDHRVIVPQGKSCFIPPKSFPLKLICGKDNPCSWTYVSSPVASSFSLL